MKFWMLFFMVILMSCDTKPYDTSLYLIDKKTNNSGETSLIEHPYIFEGLNLKLESFTYKRDGNTVTLKAVVQGDIESYKECIFFCHGYKLAESTDMLNMDLTTIKAEEKLIFSRTFSIDATFFEEVRAGLSCANRDERLLKLKLENVTVN